MPFNKKETSTDLKIKLPSGLSDSEKEELTQSIGDYLVESILNKVGEGVSPVSGNGAFKQLNKQYAENEKDGNRLANLDLFGDMLSSLEWKQIKGGVRVGIFDEDQAIKSYGHNTGFEGHPILDGVAPARKFIPQKDETFKKDILKGVDDIIREFVNERKSQD